MTKNDSGQTKLAIALCKNKKYGKGKRATNAKENTDDRRSMMFPI